MGVAYTWTQLGSSMAGVMFALAMLQRFFPSNITGSCFSYIKKYFSFFYPYIQITFHEYNSHHIKRSDAYSAIESYLGATSSSRAKRFKGDLIKNCKSLVLTMDDHEEITDEFQGVKVWWKSSKTEANSQAISLYPSSNDEKRYYVLTFNVRCREMITNAYLNFVIQEGKAIAVKNRQRKLFTNGKNDYSGELWSHIVFKHPASFESLAMEATKKNDVVNDLITFSKSKDYYASIGKAWKRGYLLYGPPGTGKSTMIAAMANLLEYDIYDLELTSVKDNTQLRKLLIEITSKSIIVIEDIDCSLDLTGQRKSKSQSDGGDNDSYENDDEKDSSKIEKAVGDEGENKKKGSEVTLSGLLNFIDGLWSASGGERIIVFTTNHVEKLDPALIRRGRMDKHIEFSYCCYESFKILAKNYLKVEFHPMFDDIKTLLEENKVTPADVAENLMPKNIGDETETSLKTLIQAIETKKEEKSKKIVKDEVKSKSSRKTFAKVFWKKKSSSVKGV